METRRRSVYLLTYSNADLEIVPTRRQFANIWMNAFGPNFVSQWACSLEKHKEESKKFHFHLAIKLNRLKRWKMIKEQVVRESGTVCHFRKFHTNYYDAFKYVTKKDTDYVTSEGHPDLINVPRTMGASTKRRHSAIADEVGECSRPVEKQTKRLDLIQLYDIIVEKGLRTEKDLFLLACNQKAEGKTDLLAFIMKQTDKRRAEILKTA